jgi:hypothetical protein
MPEQPFGTTYRLGSDPISGTGWNGRDPVPAGGVPPYGGSPVGTGLPPARRFGTQLHAISLGIRGALVDTERGVDAASADLFRRSDRGHGRGRA